MKRGMVVLAYNPSVQEVEGLILPKAHGQHELYNQLKGSLDYKLSKNKTPHKVSTIKWLTYLCKSAVLLSDKEIGDI